MDFVGAIVELYAFDAYGNAIGFDPSVALTEFLYSGEQFDSKIGQQYLRARYYDPATGRFNRLDPFFGNLTDPQSFHKYLYTHADPVSNVDPSGKSLAGVCISIAIGAGFGAGIGGYFRGVKGAIVGAFAGASAGAFVFYTVPLLISAGYSTMATGIITGTGAGFIDGFINGTLVDENGFQFSLWDGVVQGLQSGLIGGGSGFLGNLFTPIGRYLLKSSQAFRIGISSWFQTAGEHLGIGQLNTFTTYLKKWASLKGSPMRGYGHVPHGRNPNPVKQVSFGLKFDIPQEDIGKRFLYNIDDSGLCVIADDVGNTINAPFQTSHTTLASTSKAAGEVAFQYNRVLLNDFTGHGARNFEVARDFFESLGYTVQREFQGLRASSGSGVSGGLY
ncbi:MAG: RHS repeat-associated core domain-containing protein [Planctomycetaceae bacterium]|nr:RHS repeat-associated core domain-containing protein [Planctomycetaceae bacterium]